MWIKCGRRTRSTLSTGTAARTFTRRTMVHSAPLHVTPSFIAATLLTHRRSTCDTRDTHATHDLYNSPRSLCAPVHGLHVSQSDASAPYAVGRRPGGTFAPGTPHVVLAGSRLNRGADECLHLQTRTRPYTESATEQAIFTAMSTNLTRTCPPPPASAPAVLPHTHREKTDLSTMTTGHYLNNELFINGGLFWDEGVRIQHFQPVQIHVNFVVGSCCVSSASFIP